MRLAGLILLLGGSALFLYLLLARCEETLVYPPYCYVYNSNNVWFAWVSLVIPVVGLILVSLSLVSKGKMQNR